MLLPPPGVRRDSTSAYILAPVLMLKTCTGVCTAVAAARASACRVSGLATAKLDVPLCAATTGKRTHSWFISAATACSSSPAGGCSARSRPCDEALTRIGAVRTVSDADAIR